MIVNIRGTNGAGKSTVARAVMARYEAREPARSAGRRRPIGYLCRRQDGRPLWVVGHYETPCGGADTVHTVEEVFALVEEHAAHGRDVLFEGIISQDDVRRTIDLARRHELRVFALRVPMTECLAAIQSRRVTRGDVRELNPTNTVNRVRRLEGSMRKLTEAGVLAEWVSRDEAVSRCLSALGVPATASVREHDLAGRLF